MRYCVRRSSFITRVGLCSHRGSRETGLFVTTDVSLVFPLYSHPATTDCQPCDFVISRMLHQLSHTICDLLGLAQKTPFSNQFHNFIIEEVEVQKWWLSRVTQLLGRRAGYHPMCPHSYPVAGPALPRLCLKTSLISTSWMLILFISVYLSQLFL